MSVAFKLSNGFLAIVLPVLWMWPAGGLVKRVGRVFIASACLMASSLVFYGDWGWELWSHFGNPIYLLYDSAFDGLRGLAGWQR
jgi:hypothetical protein